MLCIFIFLSFIACCLSDNDVLSLRVTGPNEVVGEDGQKRYEFDFPVVSRESLHKFPYIDDINLKLTSQNEIICDGKFLDFIDKNRRCLTDPTIFKSSINSNDINILIYSNTTSNILLKMNVGNGEKIHPAQITKNSVYRRFPSKRNLKSVAVFSFMNKLKKSPPFWILTTSFIAGNIIRMSYQAIKASNVETLSYSGDRMNAGTSSLFLCDNDVSQELSYSPDMELLSQSIDPVFSEGQRTTTISFVSASEGSMTTLPTSPSNATTAVDSSQNHTDSGNGDPFSSSSSSSSSMPSSATSISFPSSVKTRSKGLMSKNLMQVSMILTVGILLRMVVAAQDSHRKDSSFISRSPRYFSSDSFPSMMDDALTAAVEKSSDHHDDDVKEDFAQSWWNQWLLFFRGQS